MKHMTAQPSQLLGQVRSPLRRAAFVGGFDDLIARARRGDRTAFSALMSGHKDDLFRLVRRRVADADAASDVVQEAFVAAWGAMANFDPERSFKTWLHAIALNKCRDAARRAATRRAFWGDCADGDDLRVVDERPSPEAETVDREELRMLREALATLPEHLREALKGRLTRTTDPMPSRPALAPRRSAARHLACKQFPRPVHAIFERFDRAAQGRAGGRLRKAIDGCEHSLSRALAK